MRITQITTGLALAIALGLSTEVASAAPVAAGLGELKSVASEASPVDKAYWTTTCWRRHGHKHCRTVWVSHRRHHRR